MTTKIFMQMRLCGLLPCVRAGDGEILAAHMAALKEEGFPCMEVDCTGEAGGMDRSTKAVLASSMGMAVGVRVKTRALAMVALGEGAAWVTLPVSECAGLEGQPVIVDIEAPSQALGPGFPKGAMVCCEAGEAKELLAAASQGALTLSGAKNADERQALLAYPQVCAIREEWGVNSGEPKEWAAALGRRWAQSLGFSLAHIGVNADSGEEAEAVAKAFARLLGMPYLPGAAADFAGHMVEVMKGNGRGARGHIGFGVNDLERGMYYARRAGFAFDPASRKEDASGQPILYYLDDDIGGFAVHLLQMERKGI